MKDINRIVGETAEPIEKSKALLKKQCELEQRLFYNAVVLRELAQKLSSNAKATHAQVSTPKSYAPSNLGVPLPLPHVPTTLQPKKTAVILRIRPVHAEAVAITASSSYARSRRR